MRYIDADKLVDDMAEYAIECIKTVDAQPTADVRENVKGHWVVDRYCSVCDFDKYEFDCCCGGWPQNFCPNCGADMRGES